MELLVALLHPAEDLDRLLLGGRGHLHRLEPPLEGPVLLDVLAVLGGGRGPDALDLAPGEGGLQDVGRVERAFRRARPDQGVQLVDEDDDVRGLGELPHDRLQALLELPAVLGAGHDQRDVEGEDPLVREVDGHVPLDDLGGEALDEGGLAHPRLADQDRVVARPPAQHLDDPLELLVAPDQGVEGAPPRGLGQVAGELGEQRRLLRLPRGRLLAQQGERCPRAPRRGACPSRPRMRRGDAALLPHQAEQDVLGADVVVEHPLRLLGGVGEDALALRGQGDLERGGDLLPVRGAPLHVLADLVHREVALGEEAGGQALALADETEQQVLGLDRPAAQLAGLVAGEEDHPPSPLGVALEHPCLDPGIGRGDDSPRQNPIIAQNPAGCRPSVSPARSGRYEPTALQPQHPVAGPGELLVVGHDHHGEAPRPHEPPQDLVQHPAGRPVEVPGRLVGEERPRASRRARAPPRPAAARRPESAPGRWSAPAREAELLEQRARPGAGPPRRGRRPMSSGIVTFSRAENSGSRWWNWKTKPRVRLRNAQRRGSAQGEDVLAGERRATRRRAGRACPSTCRSVDFPTPEAPTTASISPVGHVEVQALQHRHLARRGPVALRRARAPGRAWPRSLVPEGLGGVEPGGAAGRVEGGQEADERGRSRAPRAASPGSSRKGTQAIW